VSELPLGGSADLGIQSGEMEGLEGIEGLSPLEKAKSLGWNSGCIGLQ
jgi:hypothetical protein